MFDIIYHIYDNMLFAQTSGNYIPGNSDDKPCKMNSNVELILPSEKLRNLKLDFKCSLLNQPEKHHFDMQLSSDLIYNDDKSIKFEGFTKINGIVDTEHAHNGETKIVTTLYNQPPIVYHDSYNYEPNGEKVKITRKTIVNFDGKEATLTIDSFTFNRDFSSVHLIGKATTPYEKMHNIDFSLNHEVKFAVSFVNVNHSYLFLFNNNFILISFLFPLYF